MSASTYAREAPVRYPESDGEPMAENMLQYRWIVTIQGNLDALLEDALVAGDLFWYPVEGDNKTRRAPDVLVALGRGKDIRRSYLQWKEGGQPPDVVVEVWSPGNTYAELMAKLKWYDRFGVSEFILWDPDRIDLIAWRRAEGGELEVVGTEGGYTSPFLRCTFTLADEELQIHDAQGRPFKSFLELHAERREALEKAEQEAARAEQQAARADALAEKLRALGIDPDTVAG